MTHNPSDLGSTTVLGGASSHMFAAPPRREGPALMLAWSRTEPHRVGEVIPVETHTTRFGRDVRSVPLSRWALPVQLRPAAPHEGAPRLPPWAGPTLSREQLDLAALDTEQVALESPGNAQMLINGVPAVRGVARVGDQISLGRDVLLLVVKRPRPMWARPEGVELPPFAFGEPDVAGIVGESPPAWELRWRSALAARSPEPLLLTGTSGSGKELAARLLHLLSDRRRREMVATNAAAIDTGLLSSALFGNRRNYPNPPTPERQGLVGEAEGSRLFLDEIGELPHPLQAALLRLLDPPHTYHRLGEEDRPRTADVHFVFATNRPPEQLKHDLAARLTRRIHVPPLTDRRDDLPLIARHLFRRAALAEPLFALHFCDPTELGPEPRFSRRLVEWLLAQPLTLGARELHGLLTDLATTQVLSPRSQDRRLEPPQAPLLSGPVEEDLTSRHHSLFSSRETAFLQGLAECAWSPSAYTRSPTALHTSRTTVTNERSALLSRSLHHTAGDVERAASLVQAGLQGQALDPESTAALKDQLRALHTAQSGPPGA